MRRWYEISGRRIIEILMDRSGATWMELIEHLGISADAANAPMDVYNHLWALSDAGLIRVDGVPRDKTSEEIRKFLDDSLSDPRKIRASDEWLKMNSALQADFSSRQSGVRYSLHVSPLFGPPQDLAKQTDVFVLMPFTSERRALYEDHIAAPIRRLGLTVARADEYLTNRTIMSDVWAGICGCGVIVADCTRQNPNVFYEIGVAHTIGKPVVLITENANDVPTDLRHIKYINFDFTPRGVVSFERSLQRTVYAALGIPIGEWGFSLPDDHKGILDHEDLLGLHDAVLEARLSDSRQVLLAGIDPRFVGTLRMASNPSEQLLLDLLELNRAGCLSDQSVPLQIWLRTAIQITAPRKEAAVFQQALEVINRFADEERRTAQAIAAHMLRHRGRDH